MLNLPGPRCLGAAIAPASVYMSSLHDSATEIVCFRASMDKQPYSAQREEDAVEKENLPQVRRTPAHRAV